VYNKPTLSAGEFDALRDEVVSELRDDYHPIFAVVRGSYARHCANTDSDYDVFAVVLGRDPAEYVTETQMKTMSYEIPPAETVGLDKPIDLIVWDLQKFISEANNSDPNALAAAQSPWTLTSMDSLNSDPVGELRRHVVEQAKPFDLIRHYRSMAKSNYNKYLKDHQGTTADRRAKRWFIVTESLLRSLYIEQCCEAPPVNVYELIDAVSVDDEIESMSKELLAMKRNSDASESTMESVPAISNFIESQLDKEVTYEGYVGRDPDFDQLKQHAKEISRAAWKIQS